MKEEADRSQSELEVINIVSKRIIQAFEGNTPDLDPWSLPPHEFEFQERQFASANHSSVRLENMEISMSSSSACRSQVQLTASPLLAKQTTGSEQARIKVLCDCTARISLVQARILCMNTLRTAR